MAESTTTVGILTGIFCFKNTCCCQWLIYINFIIYLKPSVSDRCFNGISTDESGDKIEKCIKDGILGENFQIAFRKCVPDDISLIMVNTLCFPVNVLSLLQHITLKISRKN